VKKTGIRDQMPESAAHYSACWRLLEATD